MKKVTAHILTPILMLPCGLLPLAGGTAGPDENQRRALYVVGKLSPEHFIALTANVAAGDEQGLVLPDTPKSREYLKAFVQAYRPHEMFIVGPFPEGTEAVAHSLEAKAAQAIAWEESMPAELWKTLFAKAEEVVVGPREPRRLLLQAACLAGAARAPLFLLEGRGGEETELRRLLQSWGTRKVHAIGPKAVIVCRDLAKVDVLALLTEGEVSTAYEQRLLKKGPIKTLVVANPADMSGAPKGMASLAPWVALQRRGLLLLTREKGDDVGSLIEAALKKSGLEEADHLILVADLKAIPMERRPNPLEGKDETIETEPPGLKEGEPFPFATGRLFHEEPGMVSLMLARQRLLDQARGPRQALVVSNPGGGLPLLETISRNTANELRNAGYQTTGIFRDRAKKEEVRRLLPQQDIFLWEGHHSTLVAEYGAPNWPEPLQPSLVFLQSCLALTESEANPFLRRGAVAVIGAPSRTYSASGGAFTLSYFNALAYEKQSLGAALRQAKNFLLAFTLLKEKRLGKAAKLGGASVRAARAFTLWGDPTVHLPPPQRPKNALPVFRPLVEGNRVTFKLPKTAYEEVHTEKYAAQLWPNGRLAGYLTKETKEGRKHLLPLLFGEVSFPKARGEKKPRLRTSLAEDRWVFTWDSRRGTGYLLVLPRRGDHQDMVFDLEWENEKERS